MTRHMLYLIFGLLVITSYTAAARTGRMIGAFSYAPAGPAARSGAAGARLAPMFWSTGYLGGK